MSHKLAFCDSKPQSTIRTQYEIFHTTNKITLQQSNETNIPQNKPKIQLQK